MVALINPIAPTPTQGEGYSQFVVRAHQFLLPVVAEPAERNRLVWDAWSASHGNEEGNRADRFFKADKFDKRMDVCYFAEHEATSTDAKGNPVVRKYDATKLGEIIQENNLRIADVDAYPTIIDRHTAGPGMRDPSPPRSLGAAGPMRLGMVGRIEPRFAVFADEYTYKDAASEIAARPGRSVEVLTLKANGRTYINPIAAISEAPRLPLPVQFSFGSEQGELVERYTAVAPYSVTAAAYPGGANTYVEKFDSTSPNPGDSNQQESGQMLQDQDVRQIVDAIMGTDQMQWVAQQMTMSGTPAGGAPPEPEPMQPPQGGMPQAPPQSQPQAPEKFMSGMGQMNPMAGRYAASEDVETLQDQYSAMASSQRELINELAETKAQLFEIATERTDAVRAGRLHELAGRYGAVDIDSELEACLYSHNSNMDDDEFERRFGLVERYAAKAIESMPMLPEGRISRHSGDRETAQYQAKESAEIRKLVNQYANAGVTKDYNELKKEARERIEG